MVEKKKLDGEEGEGATSFFSFSFNKCQQMNFGVLKEIIMMRALFIHDKMPLVSSSIMEGLITKF